MQKTMIAGIAERKNREIETLENQVAAAQYQVNELTAVVSSLNAKQNNFAQLLTDAESKKSIALGHFNQIRQIAVQIAELRQYSEVVSQQVTSNAAVTDTAKNVAALINRLIFSVDVIEKLTDFVNRQKAVNNAIPSELISILGKAVTDSNKAVALSLIALESCYATVSSACESRTISDLEIKQAVEVEALLMGGTSENEQSQFLFKRASKALTDVESTLTDMQKAQKWAQKSISALKNAEDQHQHLLKTLKTMETAEDKTPEKISEVQVEIVEARKKVNQAKSENDKAQSALASISLQSERNIARLNTITQSQQDTALFTLIQSGYNQAASCYQKTLEASNMAGKQLDHAKSELSKATTTLNSLKAGLDAAKAVGYTA